MTDKPAKTPTKTHKPPPFRTEMDFEYGKPKAFGHKVHRLVCNNPNAFTYKGTNTYLIGATDLAVIDPGPDDPAHHEAIIQAAAGRPITTIILTHTHLDHCAGLESFQKMTGAKTAGHVCDKAGRAKRGSESPNGGGKFAMVDFAPDVVLNDGDTISGTGWELTAIHTPGHAPDHLCFEVAGTGIVLSGDHIMGWNTSVVAPPEGNMADYMASLRKLATRNDDLFLPGHGGSIEQPRRVVKAYLVHRQWRENAILELIRNGEQTISNMAKKAYPNIAPNVAAAAELSVFAHVEHLLERGLVAANGPATLAGTYEAVRQDR